MQRNLSEKRAGILNLKEWMPRHWEFEDESFDVIISRNLTWNLPHPEMAYKEWLRVLKKGGKLLNFDANWYGYLYDDKKREAHRERP